MPTAIASPVIIQKIGNALRREHQQRFGAVAIVAAQEFSIEPWATSDPQCQPACHFRISWSALVTDVSSMQGIASRPGPTERPDSDRGRAGRRYG